MYGLTFFFANYDPNSTSFIVPAEIFPARLRSTCLGIFAASSNLGQLLVLLVSLSCPESRPDKNQTWIPLGLGVRNSLFVLAGCNLLGLVMSPSIPEPKGISLGVKVYNTEYDYITEKIKKEIIRLYLSSVLHSVLYMVAIYNGNKQLFYPNGTVTVLLYYWAYNIIAKYFETQ
jgi:hypothetical protein